jgi:hypothetical protein
MLIYYNENTGEISSVMHDCCDINQAVSIENLKTKVSYIEYGRDVFYLYVNPDTEELALRAGLQLIPDKEQINLGESVNFKINTEKPFTSLIFNIGEASVQISNTEFDVKFDYPGNYYIWVNAVDYFSYPITINVTQGGSGNAG